MSDETQEHIIRWEDLSEQARSVMIELGNFGPTINVSDRLVKGCTLDEDMEIVRTYYDSNYLRVIAEACLEVSDWLDKRANSAQ